MQAELKTNPAQDFADNCGVSMRVEYVPQADPLVEQRKTGHWPMLKYRVTLSKGAVNHTFDYSAGIGHVKGLKTSRLTQDDVDLIVHLFRTGKVGKRWAGSGIMTPKNTELAYTPLLADVLFSLTTDADVLNHPNFESWAPEFGYDTDSRHAEAIYRACLENSLKIRQLIDLDAAGIAFWDY